MPLQNRIYVSTLHAVIQVQGSVHHITHQGKAENSKWGVLGLHAEEALTHTWLSASAAASDRQSSLFSKTCTNPAPRALPTRLSLALLAKDRALCRVSKARALPAMPQAIAAMRVGTAGGAVRESASAADMAFASWCNRRSALPPKSSAGSELGA